MTASCGDTRVCQPGMRHLTERRGSVFAQRKQMEE